METLVARATDEALAGPEWALNMELCDVANAQPQLCDELVRCLQHKLQSGSAKSALLALTLAETLVKNGPSTLHEYVGKRAFLAEVAALTDGSLGVDVQNHALLLIRQWADAFQGSELQSFQDVYRQLKMQGAAFPEVENDAPVFTPPSSAVSAVETGSKRQQQIEKLHKDLKVVEQKIAQLKDFHARGQSGEPLEDVLDFLHQCQPRMNTLIEGGIMGKIDERTLEECLNVNDNLMKALEECKASTGDMMRFDSPPRAGNRADVSAEMSELNLQEAGAASSPKRAPTSPRSTLTTMNDDFDSFLTKTAK